MDKRIWYNTRGMSNYTVIVADGDFPRPGGEARRLLERARRVVACDGAALAYRRRFRRWPDYTVGDFDSCRVAPSNAVRVESQDDNDLAKAIAFCRGRGWSDLVVVGATGRREDHTIGNVFRALEAQVRVVTDFGVFHPVYGRGGSGGEDGVEGAQVAAGRGEVRESVLRHAEPRRRRDDRGQVLIASLCLHRNETMRFFNTKITKCTKEGLQALCALCVLCVERGARQ